MSRCHNLNVRSGAIRVAPAQVTMKTLSARKGIRNHFIHPLPCPWSPVSGLCCGRSRVCCTVSVHKPLFWYICDVLCLEVFLRSLLNVQHVMPFMNCPILPKFIPLLKPIGKINLEPCLSFLLQSKSNKLRNDDLIQFVRFFSNIFLVLISDQSFASIHLLQCIDSR